MTGVSSLLAERFTRFLISQGFQRWLRRLLFVCAWLVRASETVGRKLGNFLSLTIIQQSIVRLAGFHILMHVHFATSKLYWCWSWHHKGAPVEGSSSSGTLRVTLWLWFAEVVEFASTVCSARWRVKRVRHTKERSVHLSPLSVVERSCTAGLNI